METTTASPEQPTRLPHHTGAYLAENRGPMVVAICVTLASISTIFVFLRLFTRGKIMAKVQLDDWLTSVSVLLQWACVACVVLATEEGNGRHVDTLSAHQKERTIFWTLLAFATATPGFGLPKIAVVALLSRLMNPAKWHAYFLWALSGTCMASLVGCIIFLYSLCTPVQSLWVTNMPERKCLPIETLVKYCVFAGSLSAFTDLYLAIYPATVLFKLQMNIRKKIGLSVALGIGSIATIIAVTKCTRLPALAEVDFSYKTADLVIWLVGEGTAIIVASCIPLLQPLVEFIFGRRALNSSSDPSNFTPNRHTRGKKDLVTGTQITNKRRSLRRDPNHDASDTELVEVESQETFLRELDPVETADHLASASADMDMGNRILRTDVVTISYDRKTIQGKIDEAKVPSRSCDDPGHGWVKL
ncbi:unnamed protein product [Clonostachys chloroleuca]|uniref:Rhodopsin domain-containing protein n=1 Tax=Clonostachys chloroleuca TaxID=1926264 RepID=A0AA35MEG9_9HYPO|nr:unnamed protein product [Clonostachys chloroleuca]